MGTIDVEMGQLKRRFGTLLEPEGERSFVLKEFHTTDPDFDKRLLPKGVCLRVQFGSELCDSVISVVGRDLPSQLVNKLNLELVEQCAAYGGRIRSVLKWLDRRIGSEASLREVDGANGNDKPKHLAEVDANEIAAVESQRHEVVNDPWRLSQQISLEDALLRFPASMELSRRWQSISEYVSGKTLEQCVYRYNRIRQQLLDAKEAEHLRQVEHREKQVRSAKLPGSEIVGDVLIVDGMESRRVGYSFVEALQVQYACLKCSKQREMKLSWGGPSFAEWCTCGTAQSLKFTPMLLHSGNQDTVGGFLAKGTVVIDVLYVDVAAACLECGSQSHMKELVRERPRQVCCRECNTTLNYRYIGFNCSAEKIVLQPKDTTVRKKKERDKRIVRGQPLPDQGTCKHYRKSHRWLRFPCCNKAFPCDVCHELGSSCAEAKWATRQICGFCAHEQRYAKDTPCSSCGKMLGAKKASAHWEGGKGCRNKNLMSVKDSKKYTNSQAKTRSNKAKRVGLAAKQARAKKE